MKNKWLGRHFSLIPCAAAFTLLTFFEPPINERSQIWDWCSPIAKADTLSLQNGISGVSPQGDSSQESFKSFTRPKHFSNPILPKTPATTVAQGGDKIGSATVISALPFSDAGTIAGFVDDYDETCPFFGPGSPDVVYSYKPLSNQTVDISLCGLSYDTKLYLYENVYTPGAPFACNDDFCGVGGLNSQLL